MQMLNYTKGHKIWRPRPVISYRRYIASDRSRGICCVVCCFHAPVGPPVSECHHVV